MNIWETLEKRLLLTYTTYDAGLKKLTVTTAAANDVIVISLSAGNTLSVSVGGVNDYNLASANQAAVLTKIEVQAGNGNDSINLGATTKAILTQTLINGSGGADTITGGAGPDEIYGGSGNDSIDGGLGVDSISGGLDNDTVSYVTRSTPLTINILDLLANDGAAGEGDWVGFGTTDVESIMGGSGNDIITGNSLGNYISGGAGADSIHGMDGSDTVVGGAGGDSIYGDNDADFIFARDGEFDVIDGGAGIDSADVDTTPAEAPAIPAAPLPADVITVSGDTAPVFSSSNPVASPKKTAPVPAPVSAFSTRRIRRRNEALAAAAAKSAKSFPSAIAAPLPAPLPASDVENPITQAALQSIVQPLDPYTKGQALITRDNQGVVRIMGTTLDDSYIIRSSAQPGTPIDIYNNGGLTQFFLPTPSLLLNSAGGSDSIDVGGSDGTGDAVFKPSAVQPGAGTITIDNHNINLATAGSPPVGTTSFTGLTSLLYVTPGTHDQITLTAQPGKDAPSQFTVQSGGVSLFPVTLNAVNGLTLDTGLGDTAADADDTIVVDVPSGAVLPQLTLNPGSSGKDSLVVNGPLVLANNPFKGPEATLGITTNAPNASITFLAPRVDLAALNLQQGSATLAEAGDKVLVTKSLNIAPQGTLDITNNSLILDYDGPNPILAVQSQIISGYQPGVPNHWNGTGITSSQAAADSNKGIGYASSNVIFGPNGGNFMGVQVDNTATLVTFTLVGDSNLDRHVGFPDLVAVAQNYGQQGTRWVGGDFNYDASTDFADLVAVAQNYGLSYP